MCLSLDFTPKFFSCAVLRDGKVCRSLPSTPSVTFEQAKFDKWNKTKGPLLPLHLDVIFSEVKGRLEWEEGSPGHLWPLA